MCRDELCLKASVLAQLQAPMPPEEFASIQEFLQSECCYEAMCASYGQGRCAVVAHVGVISLHVLLLVRRQRSRTTRVFIRALATELGSVMCFWCGLR